MVRSFNVSLHAKCRIILCTLNLASALFAHFSAICLNPSKKIGHKAWPLSSSLLFPQNLFHDYVARLPYDHGFMSLSFSTLQFTYILPGGIKNIFSTEETRCHEMCLELPEIRKGIFHILFPPMLFYPI